MDNDSPEARGRTAPQQSGQTAEGGGGCVSLQISDVADNDLRFVYHRNLLDAKGIYLDYSDL